MHSCLHACVAMAAPACAGKSGKANLQRTLDRTLSHGGMEGTKRKLAEVAEAAEELAK